MRAACSAIRPGSSSSSSKPRWAPRVSAPVSTVPLAAGDRLGADPHPGAVVAGQQAVGVGDRDLAPRLGVGGGELGDLAALAAGRARPARAAGPPCARPPPRREGARSAAALSPPPGASLARGARRAAPRRPRRRRARGRPGRDRRRGRSRWCRRSTTRTPAPSSAPDCTDSIRDSSIDIESPWRRSAKTSAKRPPLASARARTRSATAGSISSVMPWDASRQLDQASGGDEELGARGRVAGVVAAAPVRVIEAGEGLAGDAAAAHVGGGLVGVAGDPVEQHAVRLRRHQPSPPAGSARARSRRVERMSKNISEARAKRSVTATAARPSWRRAKTSPCSVATWTCSTGSPPARVGDLEAAPPRPRASDRGRRPRPARRPRRRGSRRLAGRVTSRSGRPAPPPRRRPERPRLWQRRPCE